MTDPAIQNQTDIGTALILETQSITKIIDSDQYSQVAALRARIREGIKYFTDLYKPRIDEANKHVANLRADRDKFIDPLDEASKHAGNLLSAYDGEQQRIKLQREAEERRKQQAEAAEKAQLADLAKQMGNPDLAEEILEQPEAPQPVITKDTPSAKETGVSFREIWGAYEVTDLKIVPIEYHMINDKAVTKVVDALKSACNIPGIRVLPPRKIPVQRSK